MTAAPLRTHAPRARWDVGERVTRATIAVGDQVHWCSDIRAVGEDVIVTRHETVAEVTPKGMKLDGNHRLISWEDAAKWWRKGVEGT